MTPGERRLDELVVAFAGIEPVLNDFARARVASRLRREIEELEAKEAAEYGEWAAGLDEPGGLADDGEEEDLGESWRALDRDGLADVLQKVEEHASARLAERRAELQAERQARREADERAEARRRAARHRRRRWTLLASSAAAAVALLGLLQGVREEGRDTPMLVSVLPVQIDPPSVPLVPGEGTAEEGAAASSEPAERVETVASKERSERLVRARGADARQLVATSRAPSRGDDGEHPAPHREVGAPLAAQLASEDGHRYMVGQTASQPQRSELASSGIATELAGISARAAASAGDPAPADEPTEYLHCAAAMAKGMPSAHRCLASFRARFPASIYDSDALAALAVFAAEAERCGEALPLLDEYLSRYPDRGKARLISGLRSRCEKRVLVQSPGRS